SVLQRRVERQRDRSCRRVKNNDLIMLEAMGGGFTWGSVLLRW
ncbi:MAG: 3-oxoacyl-[acyl-carrier-protein] synthase III C-terminal domain-containing protein, partial [Pseudomonadota bacterium]